MACVSSCPSGVRYDRLIESTRAAVEDEVERPLGDRLRPRAALPRPPLPRPHARGARAGAARPRAAAAEAAPAARRDRSALARARRPSRRVTPASGTATRARRPAHRLRPERRLPRRERGDRARARRGRLRGRRAAAGLLRRALRARGPARGGEGVRPTHWSTHSTDVDLVVVNASGCGSHLKELGWLLGDERAEAFSAKVRDVGELLGETTCRGRGAIRCPMKVALQDSCHLRHAQRLPLSSRVVARPHPRARGRRAGRAGPLLRLGRDLQRRAGGRCARARRPQGRARARDGRAGVRERESRLPRAGVPGRCDAGGSRCPHSTRSSSSMPRSEMSASASTARDALRRLASVAWPSATSSATSRSSRTSTTARRRSSTRSSGSRARSARTRTSPSACSTRWTSSARRASRSSPRTRPSATAGRRSTSSTRPGHADFGGEVERGLTMVDGVLLLVDASEGPLPQTRFVLRKALEARLPVILVVNKVDRPDARIEAVVNEVYELFLDLDADESQIEFPIVYCNAKAGRASLEPDPDALEPGPAPAARPRSSSTSRRRPTRRATRCRRSSRTSTRRPTSAGSRSAASLQGTIRRGAAGRVVPRRRDDRAREGDRAVRDRGARPRRGRRGRARARSSPSPGIPEVTIGETLADPDDPRPLPVIAVDEPSLSMTIGINTSPLAGLSGDKLTASLVESRLRTELVGNVSLRVLPTESPDAWEVQGRGELQLAVLVEQMRREGFELTVGKPQVVTRRDRRQGARAGRARLGRRARGVPRRGHAALRAAQGAHRGARQPRHAAGCAWTSSSPRAGSSGSAPSS